MSFELLRVIINEKYAMGALRNIGNLKVFAKHIDKVLEGCHIMLNRGFSHILTRETIG